VADLRGRPEQAAKMRLSAAIMAAARRFWAAPAKNGARLRRLAAALAFMLAAAAPAFAQQLPSIPHLDMLPAPQSAGLAAPKTAPALKLLNLRVSSAGGGADGAPLNITAIFDKKPDFSLIFLNAPPRLVVNLPPAQFMFAADAADKGHNLQSLRYGGGGAGRSRLVFGLKRPFKVDYIGTEPFSGTDPQSPWQLSLRLVPAGAAEFRHMAAAQAAGGAAAGAAAGAIGGGDGARAKTDAGRPFIVVIDPGHGDFDSGALGVNGIEEKRIVLEFAKTLCYILQRKPGIKVYLTRDTDRFLRLSARVEEARRHNADLFISIHADHIDLPNLHGATVYTLSDKASDDMAKLLAEYENKSDLLDGLPADEPPAIADILLDMTRRETRAFSEDFARRLVRGFSAGGVAMINNPRRSAGFQVLRAADIPSALVELGYLSNAGDARRIADPAWQEKTARILAEVIADYAHAHEKNKKPH